MWGSPPIGGPLSRVPECKLLGMSLGLSVRLLDGRLQKPSLGGEVAQIWLNAMKCHEVLNNVGWNGKVWAKGPIYKLSRNPETRPAVCSIQREDILLKASYTRVQ